MLRVIRSSRTDAVVPPVGISPAVLVVDPNEDCARSLADLLECCGYSVSAAIDGRMALALADPPPDIIITELLLPYLDGYELIGALRERAGTKHQLIIAVTALEREEKQKVAVRPDLHYRKPADPRVLLPALARFSRGLAPS